MICLQTPEIKSTSIGVYFSGLQPLGYSIQTVKTSNETTYVISFQDKFMSIRAETIYQSKD